MQKTQQTGRYVVVGSMARVLEEMREARKLADERGKMLLLYHKQGADLAEIGEFVALVNGSAPQMVDGQDEAALNNLLAKGTTNVVVMHGDRIPLSFQLKTGETEFRWPQGWTVVATRELGKMSQPQGPWAACFTYNAFHRSRRWQNVAERSKNDFVELVAELVRLDGVQCEKQLLADALGQLSPKNIRGFMDVRAMAETMVRSARESGRIKITRADVLVGIALKPNRGGPSADHTLQVAHMRVAGDDVPAVALQ